MELTEFAGRLDDLLDTAAFEEIDASANGLQVDGDGDHVDHAAFAVDGVVATAETAADVGADVLVVHHGIVWGGIERVTSREYDRLAAFIDNDLALYVSHLPLDAHPELGNAAGLASNLDCTVLEPFGNHGGETIGQCARADDPYTVAALRERLETLDTGDRSVRTLAFGPDGIEDIAIVTGAGTDWIREAEAAGVDALITGEGKGQAYHEAREAGVNVFLAGHYATETFGVRALRDPVEEWGIETTYIDHPTGL